MPFGESYNESASSCILMVTFANPFWVAARLIFPTDETTIVMSMMVMMPGILVGQVLAGRFTPIGGFTPKQWCWAAVACVGMILVSAATTTLAKHLLHLG